MARLFSSSARLTDSSMAWALTPSKLIFKQLPFSLAVSLISPVKPFLAKSPGKLPQFSQDSRQRRRRSRRLGSCWWPGRQGFPVEPLGIFSKVKGPGHSVLAFLLGLGDAGQDLGVVAQADQAFHGGVQLRSRHCSKLGPWWRFLRRRTSLRLAWSLSYWQRCWSRRKAGWRTGLK